MVSTSTSISGERASGERYRVPEDVTEALPDGRTILVAGKGTEYSLAVARSMGLVKDAQPVGPSEMKSGGAAADAPITEMPADPDGIAEGYEANVTDAARELAQERGVDLATVQGTGKDGAVTVADVKKAIKE